MKIMKHTYIMIAPSIAVAAVIIAGAAFPASAQTALGVSVNASASVSVGAALSSRITAITTRANEEITRRVNALNALAARVSAMARISATDKSDLSNGIEGQISAMNALQAKIAADASANSTSSLKADVGSITSSYRIFALILPQGAIEAAADRVLDISGILDDLSAKFSARIAATSAAGDNVATAQAALTDMNAKVSDANVQAQAAISEVASLTPDNGNATVMASNTAALKDAHSKIQTAQQDFLAARADAQTIIEALGTYKVSAGANASASAQ